MQTRTVLDAGSRWSLPAPMPPATLVHPCASRENWRMLNSLRSNRRKLHPVFTAITGCTYGGKAVFCPFIASLLKGAEKNKINEWPSTAQELPFPHAQKTADAGFIIGDYRPQFETFLRCYRISTAGHALIYPVVM